MVAPVAFLVNRYGPRLSGAYLRPSIGHRLVGGNRVRRRRRRRLLRRCLVTRFKASANLSSRHVNRAAMHERSGGEIASDMIGDLIPSTVDQHAGAAAIERIAAMNR